MPRATVYGMLASAVVDMLSLIAVFGIIPVGALAFDENKASYSVATNLIFGGSWAGNLVAIVVIISDIGALNDFTNLVHGKSGTRVSRSVVGIEFGKIRECRKVSRRLYPRLTSR